MNSKILIVDEQAAVDCTVQTLTQRERKKERQRETKRQDSKQFVWFEQSLIEPAIINNRFSIIEDVNNSTAWYKAQRQSVTFLNDPVLVTKIAGPIARDCNQKALYIGCDTKCSFSLPINLHNWFLVYRIAD